MNETRNEAQSKCAVTNRRVVLNMSLRALEIKTSAVFLAWCCCKNVLGWAEVSLVHHALLSVVFVCMTLLWSAVISVRAFDNSASSSLPFSSEKIFLQWKTMRKCKIRNLVISGKKTKFLSKQTLMLNRSLTNYCQWRLNSICKKTLCN